MGKIRREFCVAISVVIVVTVMLATACVRETIPSETPVTSAVNTAPSQSTGERVFPNETTEPVGYYGDERLAAALAFSREYTYQGTVLVLENGVIRYEDYSGFADVEKEILCSGDTTYEVGYVTRQFTAVGIMKLVEEGLLDLDAPLSDYIPEYSFADQMTVRMLLSMTSGIPDYLQGTIACKEGLKQLLRYGLTKESTLEAIDHFGEFETTFEAVFEQVKDRALLFEPGTDFAVSNTGYVFLAEVIERVSEIPYIHYMQKNVLTPAGLATASFSPSSDTAAGYVSQGMMQYRAPDTPLLADGGLRMNAKDLMQWIETVRERALLSKESWDIILDPGENNYGLGFHVDPDGFMIENGDAGGFSSTIVYAPSKQLMIVILLNRNSEERWADSVIRALLDHYEIDNPEI
ncbi:MAG: beta-lactamase family protein [Clostridiales bacterium]|nr:beta-lactamase family protein [Clostridiales bacterium]